MKNKTTFIKVSRKEKDFTIVDNGYIRRNDLSWKAKGMMTYILHLPQDWNVSLTEVMRHATDGEASFRSGWKELEEKGYVERYPVKDEHTKRVKFWQTIVHEVPQKPHGENPHVEKPDVAKPNVENQELLSTKELSTNKLRTNNTKDIVEQSSQSDKSDDLPYEEIIDYLNEKAERKFRHTTNKTKSLIKARANEGFELDDFKQVIDIKVAEWGNDSEMNKFLRPETLFGTKFEGYLNQPVKAVKKERNYSAW